MGSTQFHPQIKKKKKKQFRIAIYFGIIPKTPEYFKNLITHRKCYYFTLSGEISGLQNYRFVQITSNNNINNSNKNYFSRFFYAPVLLFLFIKKNFLYNESTRYNMLPQKSSLKLTIGAKFLVKMLFMNRQKIAHVIVYPEF